MNQTTAKTVGLQRADFGKTADGQQVEVFTLKNKNGAEMKVTTYGATITELVMPDRHGKLANVVLGFDNVAGYQSKDNPYFGATIGRYGNRIAGGQFELDGAKYKLPINDRDHNCLHGGLKGFNAHVWQAEPMETADGPALKLTRVSKDGEEGFPGNLTTTVTYTLTHDNAVKIDYHATTDKATPLNLTNHSYFILSGAGNGTVLDHELTIAAENYTPIDEFLIPTGEIKSVKGTPLDFTTPRKVGERIAEVEAVTHGYDHNFVLADNVRKLSFAARVHDPDSGRSVEVFTTEPAVQLYTGNWLDGKLKDNGGTYERFGALCLETQHYPDSPHHPNFPNTILRPGETYTQTTIYKFSAK